MVQIAHVAKYYTKFFLSLANKEVDLDSDTIKAMLCTSSYTPSQHSHRYKSDVTNEISGTGYTAGGATVGSVTVANSSGVVTIDGADAAWSGSTFAARCLVLYDSTPGSDSTRPLIGYVLFDADISVTGSTFTVTWDASGIATITVS